MELPTPLLSKVVRTLVTVLVLAALAWSVDVHDALAALLGADVRWLVPALLTILGTRLLMALRWWLILSAYGFSFGLWEVTKLIFVSSSLGSVLPAGIGQDLLRGYHVFRAQGRASDVSASIIVDRVVGIVSMALVSCIAGIFVIDLLERSRSLRIAVLSACAILVGLAALYPLRRVMERRIRFENSGLPERLAERLNELWTAVFRGPVGRGILASTLLLAVLVQLARTAAFVLVFTSLGASTDSLHYLVAIPMVFLLLQAPISLGGLGVREAALVVFFQSAGFRPEVSIAGGLIFQCLQLVVHLPGLAFFVLGGNRRGSRVTR